MQMIKEIYTLYVALFLGPHVGTPANIADIHRDRHDCRIGARNHDQYVPQGFIHRVGPHELHLHHPINCLVRFLDSFFRNR